jgi:hypothetical protein
METQNLADYHVIADLADRDDFVYAAFHRDRCTGDSWRTNNETGRLLEPHFNEFVGLRRRPAPVKNEIGARLAIPSFDKVLIQPMARGRILPMRSLGVDRVECCAIDNHVTPFFNFVRVYWNELSSAAQDFGRWPTGVLDSSKLKVP